MEEFTKEFVTMWKKWNVFDGKANVRDFWMAYLVTIIISIVLGILGRMIGIFSWVGYLYSLAIIIPSISLGVRRMHDVGKSGLYLLWMFLPFVGWIIVLIALIQKGE